MSQKTWIELRYDTRWRVSKNTLWSQLDRLEWVICGDKYEPHLAAKIAWYDLYNLFKWKKLFDKA